MPTPRAGYTVDGQKVPSVTGILSRFKESGALMWWANQEGLAGRSIRGEDSTALKAAEIGTVAHLMVECDIKGTPFDATAYPAEVLEPATRSYEAYLQWKSQTNLQPYKSEMGLVSKKYKFGGTLDMMLIKGKLSIGDIKTSSGVYQDYLIQLAAYGLLWTENFPNEPIEGGYHLLRFSKSGDLETRWWSDLSEAEEAFILMRQLYNYDKILKARL